MSSSETEHGDLTRPPTDRIAGNKAAIQELLETAREHFREGNYKVTEGLLQQLLAVDAKNPEVFHMMGTIFYDRGKFNKAIKTFRRALQLDPSFTDASVGLSIILNDLGRYEEGRQVFVEAQAALARKSNEPDSYSQEKIATKHDELGELYSQHKRYDEALEQYERALTMSSRKAELRMKMVECFIKLDDDTRAIRELRSLIQEYPQFIPARLKLGLIYFNAKRTVEAVEQWESVLLRDPEHPVAIRYLQMAQESGSTLLA